MMKFKSSLSSDLVGKNQNADQASKEFIHKMDFTKPYIETLKYGMFSLAFGLIKKFRFVDEIFRSQSDDLDFAMNISRIRN